MLLLERFVMNSLTSMVFNMWQIYQYLVNLCFTYYILPINIIVKLE